jgi:hypothetical protein
VSVESGKSLVKTGVTAGPEIFIRRVGKNRFVLLKPA